MSFMKAREDMIFMISLLNNNRDYVTMRKKEMLL